jgi:hypothetical protein
MREQLLPQHGVAAAHVVEHLEGLASERAHDADAENVSPTRPSICSTSFRTMR